MACNCLKVRFEFFDWESFSFGWTLVVPASLTSLDLVRWLLMIIFVVVSQGWRLAFISSTIGPGQLSFYISSLDSNEWGCPYLDHPHSPSQHVTGIREEGAVDYIYRVRRSYDPPPLPSPKRSGHLLQNWRTNIIIPRPLICIGSYKENRYTSIHSSIHAPLMHENRIILHCIVVGGPIDDPVHTAGEYTCVHLSMYEHLKKW